MASDEATDEATRNVDLVLVNLKILAGCEPFNRLNVTGRHFSVVRSNASVAASVQRWYNGESRYVTTRRVRDLFREANRVLRATPDAALRGTIHRHIRAAISGVASLQRTYKEDPTTVCMLQHVRDVGESYAAPDDG